MAAFFSASADQRDSMPNHCLRDPGNSPYPEHSATGNVAFHNYSSNPYSDAASGVLVPLPATVISQGSFSGVSNMAASRLGEQCHVSRGDGRAESAILQAINGSAAGASELVQNAMSNHPDMGLQTQLLMLKGQPNTSAVPHQGLSLSLGTQIPVPVYQFRPTSPDATLLSPHQSIAANAGSWRDASGRNMQANVSSPGNPTLAISIQNSKYLKAARELLDQAVNVREAMKRKADKNQSHMSAGMSDCKGTDAGSKSEDKLSNPQESTVNASPELLPSERQDLQNRVTALLALLDQVDRRYRHYYHQMQIVMSSFDVIAGPGAAKPYTALALQTISRHFRSLRDAISGQIQAARKSLGEQDTSNKGSGISRLRYIDQQIRQQRAMQQFGMMQQHTWRPQRGLPESSVSILRAWLFEHFLHPYPKDSEKLMLARQTGLSRGQVSNWFINARVRLWKPMIEDMYKEEFGDAEIDSNSSSENPPKGKDEARSSEDRTDLQSPSTERNSVSQLNSYSKSDAMAMALDVGASTVGFRNTDSSMNAYTNLNLNHQRRNEGDSSLLQDALVHPNGNARFMAYHMAELGGYESAGVSLTLGLQQCNGAPPASNEHQSLLAVREDDIYGGATDFEYMNNSEDRQRFGSSQLLHDFVA